MQKESRREERWVDVPPSSLPFFSFLKLFLLLRASAPLRENSDRPMRFNLWPRPSEAEPQTAEEVTGSKSQRVKESKSRRPTDYKSCFHLLTLGLFDAWTLRP